MENNIMHTMHNGERVSSAYAEIYLNESYCNEYNATHDDDINNIELEKSLAIEENQVNNEWTSPSDLLIDIIELKPPFTSKITRGKTHEGILSIGDNVLQSEQEKFVKQLNTLIHENDAAWKRIEQHEKQSVSDKVGGIYHNLLQKKSEILTAEISSFYENSLQELENHLQSEVQKVLISVNARIISNLNIQIKNKLKKEKNTLEKILKAKYNAEEEKVKKYYELLLQNELHRNNTLVRNAILERNEALKVFLQQFEMENITNTMYVMSTERKKCKIKKMVLENYQDTEIVEKIKKVKESDIIIEDYKKKDVLVSNINKEWEEKIKKILQLFLKFISYSFKLLPEQSTFLLDFEKMVILQINEIVRQPQESLSILVENEKLDNTLKFDLLEQKEGVYEAKPLVITGNLEDPTPPRYGSRETLDSDVDLATIRLQRQFIYAKCHEYEEIKKVLENQRCKCRDFTTTEVSVEGESNKSLPSTSTVSESSYEPLLVNDINRLHECPVRKCKDWGKRCSFPSLESYLEFSENNFKLVQDILKISPNEVVIPEQLGTKTVIHSELPFSPTKEHYHSIETQYSSQENVYVPDFKCSCIDNYISVKPNDPPVIKEPENVYLNRILMQRRNSIKRLLYKHTGLLKIFTDESFDFGI